MASPIPTDYETKSKPSLNFHWLAPWIYTNKYKQDIDRQLNSTQQSQRSFHCKQEFRKIHQPLTHHVGNSGKLNKLPYTASISKKQMRDRRGPGQVTLFPIQCSSKRICCVSNTPKAVNPFLSNQIKILIFSKEKFAKVSLISGGLLK